MARERYATVSYFVVDGKLWSWRTSYHENVGRAALRSPLSFNSKYIPPNGYGKYGFVSVIMPESSAVSWFYRRSEIHPDAPTQMPPDTIPRVGNCPIVGGRLWERREGEWKTIRGIQ